MNHCVSCLVQANRRLIEYLSFIYIVWHLSFHLVAILIEKFLILFCYIWVSDVTINCFVFLHINELIVWFPLIRLYSILRWYSLIIIGLWIVKPIEHRMSLDVMLWFPFRFVMIHRVVFGLLHPKFNFQLVYLFLKLEASLYLCLIWESILWAIPFFASRIVVACHRSQWISIWIITSSDLEL